MRRLFRRWTSVHARKKEWRAWDLEHAQGTWRVLTIDFTLRTSHRPMGELNAVASLNNFSMVVTWYAKTTHKRLACVMLLPACSDVQAAPESAVMRLARALSMHVRATITEAQAVCQGLGHVSVPER